MNVYTAAFPDHIFSQLMRLKSLLFIILFLCSSPIFAISVEELSLEEKVGQLFITYFEGEEINEYAEKLICEMNLGGIIYYTRTNGLTSPDQIKSLSFDLQNLSKKHTSIPLFIAIDQEGGAVSHLTNMNHPSSASNFPKHFFTDFPGNMPLGRTKHCKLAYRTAMTTGHELQSVGINLNFAPVLDVNSNPNNPVIGVRSFGHDPESISNFGLHTIKGFLKTGVIPCCKHFPGHGNTDCDSHYTLPTVDKSLDTLQQTELIPFLNLLDKTPMIMTAHVLYPEIDPDHCATLSPMIVTNLLREHYQYKGLIITDSLTMNGISSQFDGCDAALRAFEAGNDLLLIGDRFPHDYKNAKEHIEECLAIHQGFLDAVKSGRISEDRIDQSVRRILTLKEKYHHHNKTNLLKLFCENSGANIPSSDIQLNASADNEKIDSTFCPKGCDKCRLAQEIAYRSVFPKKLDLSLEIENQKIAIVCPERLKAIVQATDLPFLGAANQIFSFKGINPSDFESLEILQAIESFDLVIVCSWDAQKIPRQLQLIKNIGFRKPMIAISTKGDDFIEEFQNVKIHIVTYSPSLHSLRVAVEWIYGKFNTFEINNLQIKQIGKKIWKNECGGNKEMLTSWNKNEPFPSLGIGHFIWPPEGYSDIFSEGEFHKLIAFLQQYEIEIPQWIVDQKYAPWKDRQEFIEIFHSEEMKELRTFLANTAYLQTLYMVDSLHRTFIEMVNASPDILKEHLINQFFRLAFSKNGLYILVDYMNFKGSGLNKKQRYEGQGWGLFQVLEDMENEKKSPSKDFVKSAKELLIQRVKNSPHKELEEKWIRGWLKRIETYLTYSMGSHVPKLG